MDDCILESFAKIARAKWVYADFISHVEGRIAHRKKEPQYEENIEIKPLMSWKVTD